MNAFLVVGEGVKYVKKGARTVFTQTTDGIAAAAAAAADVASAAQNNIRSYSAQSNIECTLAQTVYPANDMTGGPRAITVIGFN